MGVVVSWNSAVFIMLVFQRQFVFNVNFIGAAVIMLLVYGHFEKIGGHIALLLTSVSAVLCS